MTPRPTTMVESDQLARAAVDILRNEDFVPKGKRFPFWRHSKAHRDYEKAVQDITARRRTSRERALEEKLKAERLEADAAFERAKASAEADYSARVAEVTKPYDEIEVRARQARDAAIAAAHATYEETLATARTTCREETAKLDEKRETLVGEAQAARRQAHTSLEARRQSEQLRIARELKTIPLEGPMRVVEDREAWTLAERKRALLGLVDMAAREDFDAEVTALCLRNVSGYVFQDRFLKPDAQHHRLMDASLLERIADLARRTPEKRPLFVRYMHEIVMQNFGHSSPTLIRLLSELYVVASDDTELPYAADPVENEKIVETMREQIADTLKLTPRRSQVPPPPESPAGSEPAGPRTDDAETPKVDVKPSDAETTAEVDVGQILAVDDAEAHANHAAALADGSGSSTASATPPPLPKQRRGKKVPVPESS